jgi:hypothetical protein
MIFMAVGIYGNAILKECLLDYACICAKAFLSSSNDNGGYFPAVFESPGVGQPFLFFQLVQINPYFFLKQGFERPVKTSYPFTSQPLQI